MPTDINAYIVEARKLKVSDDQIKATLTTAGWPVQDIDAALAGKDITPILPPPPPVVHSGMWTGFLYILFFISLYTLATSLAGVFNAGIDKVFPASDPDSLSLFGIYKEQIIRGYVAALIVSYPIFAILAVQLKRQLGHNPAVKNIRSRKLLIYITLIATFLLLLWQIITILYSFLNGNVTSNTVGHFAIITVIVGSIFVYFINEVKNDRKSV